MPAWHVRVGRASHQPRRGTGGAVYLHRTDDGRLAQLQSDRQGSAVDRLYSIQRRGRAVARQPQCPPSPFEIDQDSDNRSTLAELKTRFALIADRFNRDKDGLIRRSELLTLSFRGHIGRKVTRHNQDF